MDDVLTVRHANVDDARDIWLWRNDAETRRSSRSTDLVSWPDHQAWFSKAIVSEMRRIYIALLDGHKVGMVRFDAKDDAADCWLVSIMVAPNMRGRGLATQFLAQACERIAVENAVSVLDAEIRNENSASLKIFSACGFVLVDPSVMEGQIGRASCRERV